MLWELAAIFGRLGATSFGGPLAHIALMREEFVERRQWLSDAEFLDLCGAVNLIPGPNSTELAMHIGHKRGGNVGLWVAGMSFIAPAFTLVLIFAALYARFGLLTPSRAILWGIAPVVVVIVAQALLKFAPSALKNRFSQGVALLSLAAAALGANEIAIIFAAAAAGALIIRVDPLPKQQHPDNNREHPDNNQPDPLRKQEHPHNKREHPHNNQEKPDNNRPDPDNNRDFPLLMWVGPVLPASSAAFGPIFWSFFKIGALIYGSGYVLLAYLRAEFVEKLGLLSDRQLIDAIALGQLTPGPLFTSATFVGFQIGGLWGAIAATMGIFLPSFGFVMILGRGLEGWSGSPRARHFLDSVSAASFALMALVTLQLGRAAFFPARGADWGAVSIGLVAAALLWKTKWNSALILALGAASGLVLRR